MSDEEKQPGPKSLRQFLEYALEASPQSPRHFLQGLILITIGTVVSGGVGPFLSQASIPQRLYLPIGIAVVVSFGCLGLVFRAVGEWVRPERSANWKGAGYLMGAFAYVVTASVSLSGAAHLLPSQ